MPPLARFLRYLRLGLHLVEGLLTVLLVYPFAGIPWRERRMVEWSRRILAILGIRLEARGALPAAASGNVLLVANHVSWLDIYLLLSLLPLRFVSKAEVRQWPLVGWLAEKTGTLFLERGRRADAARVNRHIGDVLAAGGLVGFFPEGTTSDGTELKHFHTSLLEPAVLAGATVQPVALRYRRPDGRPSLAPAYTGDITMVQTLKAMAAEGEIVGEVVFLAPISAVGRNRRELARLAEEAIRGALGFGTADREPGTSSDPPGA
ncbi:MAG: lysophospholipid acyltransferase family protein [Sulfuricellaceae bacterium]|jgi:1-acyl-sn-glycerol-3-phosphate acyltransferase